MLAIKESRITVKKLEDNEVYCQFLKEECEATQTEMLQEALEAPPN
jgi:hypothetical protein